MAVIFEFINMLVSELLIRTEVWIDKGKDEVFYMHVFNLLILINKNTLKLQFIQYHRKNTKFNYIFRWY